MSPAPPKSRVSLRRSWVDSLNPHHHIMDYIYNLILYSACACPDFLQLSWLSGFQTVLCNCCFSALFLTEAFSLPSKLTQTGVLLSEVPLCQLPGNSPLFFSSLLFPLCLCCSLCISSTPFALFYPTPPSLSSLPSPVERTHCKVRPGRWSKTSDIAIIKRTSQPN